MLCATNSSGTPSCATSAGYPSDPAPEFVPPSGVVFEQVRVGTTACGIDDSAQLHCWRQYQ
jgi:hypothetical protein